MPAAFAAADSLDATTAADSAMPVAAAYRYCCCCCCTDVNANPLFWCARYDVPALAFINKCDRPGSNPAKIIKQLRDKLKHNAAAIQIPIGLESDLKGVIDIIGREAIYFDGDNGEIVRRESVPEEFVSEMEEKRQELIAALADVR